jgi:hypothetical protein
MYVPQESRAPAARCGKLTGLFRAKNDAPSWPWKPNPPVSWKAHLGRSQVTRCIWTEPPGVSRDDALFFLAAIKDVPLPNAGISARDCFGHRARIHPVAPKLVWHGARSGSRESGQRETELLEAAECRVKRKPALILRTDRSAQLSDAPIRDARLWSEVHSRASRIRFAGLNRTFDREWLSLASFYLLWNRRR